MVATARAARPLGGVTPNFGRPLQLSHDLISAEAVVWIARNEPASLDRLLGEDFLRRRERALTGFNPDAAIVGEDGRVVEAGAGTKLRESKNFTTPV